MDLSDYQHSDSIRIRRPATEVYGIVSDVTRMGELSPVCKTCQWDDRSQAGTEGAWFTGHNVTGERSWDTRCQVVTAVPGRDFTFVNYGPQGQAELVRWGYLFDDHGDETTVTETWQVLPAYPDFVTGNFPSADVEAWLEDRAATAREGIRDTLASLKRVAEA